MEILPEEIILLHIFPFLNPEDIFNIGECSQRLRNIVADNILHPLSTELQYLKVRKKFFVQEESVYDNIDCFRNIKKMFENNMQVSKLYSTQEYGYVKPINMYYVHILSWVSILLHVSLYPYEQTF